MGYFPLVLDLTGRPVLLVGGGRETLMRVRSLLEAGARVTVVCPVDLPGLAELEAAGRIRWLRREYRAGDVEGHFLVVSDPPDRDVNARVFREAEARRVFMVAVDDPPNCSAIFPAVHRQGELILAVSTSGVSPALAVRIKERLSREFGPEYGLLLQLLRELRPEVAARYPDFRGRKAAWYRLVDSSALSLLREGKVREARETLRRIM
jgi:precorrin-2 dehydrogenase/sirohydrochlorin ferrochelatase